VDRIVRGSVIRTLEAGGNGRVDTGGNGRLDALERRADAVDQRVRWLDRKADTLDERAGSLDRTAATIQRRIDEIEKRLASFGPAPDTKYLRLAGRRAMTVLGLLSPDDPVGAELVRLGGAHDGGYVLVESLLRGGIAYSFGVGDDVSWDLAMADRGYQVYLYDNTIDALPVAHPGFHFSKIGLCAAGASAVDLRSLEELLAQNGHLGGRDMVLKIDIEGAEWTVLETLPRTVLQGFSQIVIEFHSLGVLNAMYDRIVAALRALREEFVPIHVHGNNACDITVVGGVPVPDILEVTFVRRGQIATKACTRTFPTALDQTNLPEPPDLYLGSFQFPRPADGS
jgi:hypothetical protein